MGTETIVHLVQAWATRDPGRVALHGRDGRIDFGALNSAANRVADVLRRRFGARDGFVGICLPRTPERVIAMLGILKAGLAYVPIDPRLHSDGKRDLAAHSDACAVITSGDAVPVFVMDRPALDIRDLPATGGDENPEALPALGQSAYIRYTSGSTGAPKGVWHTHRAAIGLARGFVESVGLRADDRVCCLTFFPHALVHGCLLAGATFVCIDPTREGLRDISRRLREEKVTVLSCFPSALRAMAQILCAAGPLPDLRCVSMSGELVTADDVNLALRCVAPGGMVTNNYGTSEFVQIAYHWIDHDLPAGASVPVGRAISGVELRLLGPDGNAAPEGAAGEIVLRSPFMSSGYWKRPDLSRAAFGSETPQDGRTDYRTGDIGRLDADGALHVLGRVDNQIKLRAHRVTPEEIEVVLRQHPSVAETAVRAFTTEDGTMMLAVFVVPASGYAFDAVLLRDHARELLPPYLIPAAFIPRESLPQTPGGKLLRAELPDPLPFWRSDRFRASAATDPATSDQ